VNFIVFCLCFCKKQVCLLTNVFVRTNVEEVRGSVSVGETIEGGKTSTYRPRWRWCCGYCYFLIFYFVYKRLLLRISAISRFDAREYVMDVCCFRRTQTHPLRLILCLFDWWLMASGLKHG
jgi:hypothetical protein